MKTRQPGVQHTVVLGFYGRAELKIAGAARFAAGWPGTKFPVSAHVQWIQNIFIGNQVYEGKYCLPSFNPQFDGKPVNMAILKKPASEIFDYKVPGSHRPGKDPVSPGKHGAAWIQAMLKLPVAALIVLLIRAYLCCQPQTAGRIPGTG